jgi:hypothetical protein
MRQTKKAGHSSVIGYGFHSHSFLNEGTSHDLGEHVSAASTHQCSRIARDGIAGKAARRERCRNRPGIVTCPAARPADFKRDKARICRRFSRRSALTSARREESTSRIARAARYTLISSSLFDLGGNHRGFGIGWREGLGWGVAQVGPLFNEIWPKFFTSNNPCGESLNFHSERFTTSFSVSDVSKVANGRVASDGHFIALAYSECRVKSSDVHGVRSYTPFGEYATPFSDFTERLC